MSAKTPEVPKVVDISAFASLRKGPRCTVCAALDLLTPEQLEQATAALVAPEILRTRIANVLTDWTPIRVSVGGVTTHRSGKCNGRG